MGLSSASRECPLPRESKVSPTQLLLQPCADADIDSDMKHKETMNRFIPAVVEEAET